MLLTKADSSVEFSVTSLTMSPFSVLVNASLACVRIWVNPTMALSGVRISWLMSWMNFVFFRQTV